MFGERIENKETPRSEPDLKVDLVRHGKPEYTSDEISTANFEGKLTEEGAAQIAEQALRLAERIDKEKEVAVFWVSPKRRAQETAAILYETFIDQGIPVVKDPSVIRSLSDVKVSPEYVREIVENNAIDDWMEYWSQNEPPEGVETPAEVRRRVERVVTYLERIARKVVPDAGRRLHFICVGHEEIFRDLLDEGYEMGTADGTGPEYGEVMSMDIRRSEKNKDAKLLLEYRGQKAELGFEKEKRRFYKNI